jgi:hypothetical protein
MVNMAEICSPACDGLPHIPDDLTLPQFILDSRHLTRPVRQANTPWLIEDSTGKTFGLRVLSFN